MRGRDITIETYEAACALGDRAGSVSAALFDDAPLLVHDHETLIDGRSVPVGRVPFSLDGYPGRTRTNRLLAHLYAGIADAVMDLRETVGPKRLAVVIGTSTTGIGEGGKSLAAKLEDDCWPEDFSLQDQELGDTAAFAAALSGAQGPCYTISTACTSGARAMASGARLLLAGLCDAVLCGGVDSLCDLTLNGFAALDSISDAPCNPMSRNRKGINIGEGGALFLLSRRPGPHRIAGWGESSDSHHISAPDPSGQAPERAIRRALDMAGAAPEDVGFVHLHGTATRLNDRMEAGVVHRLFGADAPSSSTKPLTGHTLGAAGALQAAFCLMAMESGRLPPHLWDHERDPELPTIRLVAPGEREKAALTLSASYAFGGNNAALALATS
jgi:3-oxoacyl-[acyl-carrier-protein] synthase-1